MDGVAVFLCPFCKCYKDVCNKVLSIQELGCNECKEPTCKYLYGEEEYHKHLVEVHHQEHPKHKVLIDGQLHIVEDL